MIFQQSVMIYFNIFVFKIFHLFTMWSGIQFFLVNLCRIIGDLIVEDNAGIEGL
jgi:hypothetical protein